MADWALVDYAWVGKSPSRIDGVPKATGQSQYAADLWRSGCLHGQILRSPYPHARILHVDVSRATAVPGVKAVLTAKDVPSVRIGQFILDETLFKADKVRYIGDEVAAVAAADQDAAQGGIGSHPR